MANSVTTDAPQFPQPFHTKSPCPQHAKKPKEIPATSGSRNSVSAQSKTGSVSAQPRTGSVSAQSRTGSVSAQSRTGSATDSVSAQSRTGSATDALSHKARPEDLASSTPQDKYSHMKLLDLRRELKTRGLNTRGSIPVLRRRLAEHDSLSLPATRPSGDREPIGKCMAGVVCRRTHV